MVTSPIACMLLSRFFFPCGEGGGEGGGTEEERERDVGEEDVTRELSFESVKRVGEGREGME